MEKELENLIDKITDTQFPTEDEIELIERAYEHGKYTGMKFIANLFERVLFLNKDWYIKTLK